jgi:hypothetical protein
VYDWDCEYFDAKFVGIVYETKDEYDTRIKKQKELLRKSKLRAAELAKEKAEEEAKKRRELYEKLKKEFDG